MSIVDPIRRRLCRSIREGYPFIGAFALASLILFWIWTPLGWIGTILTVWCAYVLPRSAARHAGARGHRGVAGRRPRQHDRAGGAAAGTRSRRPAAAAHLDLHERVRLPREPQPGRRPRRAHRSTGRARSSTPNSTRRARTTSATALVIATPSGRIGVVQIAGLVARRIVCFVREGAVDRRRRALRHDPLRLAARRLSAGRRARRWSPRGRRRSPARPCWPTSRAATAGRTLAAPVNR